MAALRLARDPVARRDRPAWLVVLLLAAAPLARPAQGQNLLPEPSFDTTGDLTAGWGNLGAGKYWTSVDVDSDPSSGSVRIDNSSAGAGVGFAIFSTCLDVVPVEPYAFSAWQYTPFLQATQGFAQLQLQWRESCPTGAFTGGDILASSTEIGTWTLVSGHGQAPPGATGARLWLIAGKVDAGGTYSVYFDEAFVPEPAVASGEFAAGASLLAMARRRARRSARPVRDAQAG